MISRSIPPLHRVLRRCGAFALLALFCATASSAQDVDVIPTGTPLPVRNVPFTVDLAFDLGLSPSSATLFYRTTGSGDAYDTISATATGEPDTLAVSVPGDVFDPAGVDFYVEYVVEGETRTFPELNPALAPLQLPVVSRVQEAPIVLRSRQYQMITLPFAFVPGDLLPLINGGALLLDPEFRPIPQGRTDDPASVLEDLGEYNEETWRVLRWNPVAETYLNGPIEVGTFRPGYAFWVASADGGGFGVRSVIPRGFVIPPLEDIDTFVFQSQPIQVLLEPGWNQIGSPYLFPVAWDDVEGSDVEGVRAPVASVLGEYEPEQSVLQPWAGYFVENTLDVPVPLTFRISPDELGGASPEQAPLATRLLQKAGDDAFLLQIQTDEITSNAEPLQTRNTFVGIGREDLHIALPPPVSDGLRVRLRTEDGQTLASAIDATSDGAAWTLDLRAPPTWSETRRFEVRLDEHGARPAGWSYRLTDAVTGEPVPLAGASFSVSLGSDHEARQFRLTLGPDAALGADTPPTTAPLFGRVGPNPVQSGRGVDVSYRTPGGRGEIVVLDLLGRPVHRLVTATDAGWHDVTWDGQTAGGSVAPGLYLLHLRTPEGQAVRKLTVLR
jgi:hypothetical protein